VLSLFVFVLVLLAVLTVTEVFSRVLKETAREDHGDRYGRLVNQE
jgi:hypothetical protein